MIMAGDGSSLDRVLTDSRIVRVTAMGGGGGGGGSWLSVLFAVTCDRYFMHFSISSSLSSFSSSLFFSSFFFFFFFLGGGGGTGST